MTILQVCKKFPYPLKDGESIAITYLAKALAQIGHRVTLLAMNTSRHWACSETINPANLPHYQAVHTVAVDNRIKPWAAAKNLFSKRSYHVERFINPHFEHELARLLQQQSFDVVQLESPFLAPYIPTIRRYSNAKVVLRAHNVEHEIWERVAVNSSPARRWYLEAMTPRLKAFEIKHLNDYDLVAGITERDLAQFEALGLVQSTLFLPIGLDCRDYHPNYKSYTQPLSLCFIGSLDWMPNVEGLTWFLRNVWEPLVVPAQTDWTFHIAGRNMPDWLRKLNLRGVVVHGEVPDARDFINKHAVMVAPLLSGGGMRAKILEGMALGKVVLSSTIGIEGIPARHEQEALVADTPAEFFQALQWCAAQGPCLQKIGEQARQFCTTAFDNRALGQRLTDAYYQLLQRKETLAV